MSESTSRKKVKDIVEVSPEQKNLEDTQKKLERLMQSN